MQNNRDCIEKTYIIIQNNALVSKAKEIKGEYNSVYDWKEAETDSFDEIYDSQDYIVIIGENIEDAERIVEKLVEKGIKRKRLLNYNLYRSNATFSPYSALNKKKKYQHLIFGMSHARLGINAFQLESTYNFADMSLDLFYQYQLIKRLDRIPGFFSKCKSVYFEMPYYYFNYDLSMTKSFSELLRHHIEINSIHHIEESDEIREMAASFKKMMQLIKPKYFISDRMKYDILQIKKIICKKQYVNWADADLIKASSEISKVWTDLHEKTIEENLAMWRTIKEFFELKRIKTYVIVMPFLPDFQRQHMQEINCMKERFYSCLAMEKGEVLDYFDCFSDIGLFTDHCHLSGAGAYSFTNKLKSRMN